jgi:hypothetical protein
MRGMAIGANGGFHLANSPRGGMNTVFDLIRLGLMTLSTSFI